MEQKRDDLIEMLERVEKALCIQAKQALNIDEAAYYIHRSSDTLKGLNLNNEIPFYKNPKGVIYYKKADLDAWLLKTRYASADETQNTAGRLIQSKPLQNKKQSRIYSK